MQQLVSMTRQGASCVIAGQQVMLDPKRLGGGLSFVSHAHMDHLPSASSAGDVLCSAETQAIARARGRDMASCAPAADGMRMVDSGHILGSRGLLGDGVFYTGDICTRDRPGIAGARVPRCETLITECTFGLPEFSFPPVSETLGRVSRIISELYARGIPAILMGYQLGKAQTISSLFGDWEPMYYHDSVKEMNDLHRGLGADIPDAMGHTEAERLGKLDAGPWVMVAPMMPEKSGFVARAKKRYGAVTIGFSGWAGSRRFSLARRCDYSAVLSDHCDYAELMQMVSDTGASRVYTVHGFAAEFAQSVQEALGVTAEPLAGSVLGA